MVEYQPRYYQKEAVDAAFSFLKKNPEHGTAIDLHTGAGKTIVIAELIKKVTSAGLRCICLVDRSELVKQNKAQMQKILGNKVSVGAYCASIGEKDINTQVVMASIQSMNSALKKDPSFGGVFKLILVDECHMVKPEDEGMYRAVISNLRARTDNTVGLVGLTATPYRMGSGFITAGEDSLFKTICYSYPISRGLEDGYAVPLTTQTSSFHYSDEGMKISKNTGDYTASSLSLIEKQDNITEQAVKSVVDNMKAQGRKSCLIFCANIAHVEKVHTYLTNLGSDCRFGMVHSKQDASINKKNIELFQKGYLHGLVNCDALTVGFDAPMVDILAILRKIGSIPLWVQILGRGIRIYPNKKDCLVLDFGKNVEKMPPLVSIGAKFEAQAQEEKQKKEREHAARLKMCPDCKVDNIPYPVMTCPVCGFKFENLLILSGVASVRDILYGDLESIATRYLTKHLEVRKITKVLYTIHHKQVGFKKFDMQSIPSIRCDFRDGLQLICSHWLCFEHGVFMVDKAMRYVDAVSPYTLKHKITKTSHGLELSREWVHPSAVIFKKSKSKTGKPVNKFVGLIVGGEEKIVDIEEYKREYYTQTNVQIGDLLIDQAKER